MEVDLRVTHDMERLLNEEISTELDSAIGLAVGDISLNFDFGFPLDEFGNNVERSTAASENPPENTFVPPGLSSPVDVGPPKKMTRSDPSSLKQTCSKRSIDSGYGSMHSRAGRITCDLNDAPPSPQDVNFSNHKVSAHLQTTNSEQLFVSSHAENIDYSFLDQGLYETLDVAQNLEDQVLDDCSGQYW